MSLELILGVKLKANTGEKQFILGETLIQNVGFLY